MTTWACGVTSVLSRSSTLLPATLASLEMGGFRLPHIFLDGATLAQAADVERQLGREVTSRPPPRIGCYGNWMLGLAELYLRNPDADRYAMFQDDIECVTNLRAYLDSCRFPAKGFWNLYTMPPGWQVSPPAPDFVGWRESNQCCKGALGLVFDRRAVVRLLTSQESVARAYDAELPKRKRNLDGLVGHLLCDKWKGEPGWREWVHFPSLVQHKGVLTTVRDFAKHLPEATSFPGADCDASQWIGKEAAPSTQSGQPAAAASANGEVDWGSEVDQIRAALAADDERRSATSDPREVRRLDRWRLEYQRRLREAMSRLSTTTSRAEEQE